ncbi:MAG: alkaline phosphatase D family protein [Thiotrichales bacterium]
MGKKIGREHHSNHERVILDNYRKRHVQYKSDAGLIAIHAKHSLIFSGMTMKA